MYQSLGYYVGGHRSVSTLNSGADMQQDNLRHNTISSKKDKSGVKDYSKVTMNFSSNVQIQKQKVPVAFQGVFDKLYSKLFVEKNPNSNFAKDFLNKPTTGIDLCEMNQQLANDMLVDEKYKDMKNYNSVEEAEAVRNKSFMNTKEFYQLSEYIVSNELKNSLTGLEGTYPGLFNNL